ncbi:Hsp20/alpha crystallin family protein [Phenylobacterium sp.]|uniref:Hsp20/alpha crystallin family protein n=1 Tax=Phenylobacterium sp. TaxID=1871053 RepID=UPI00345D6A76
MTSLSTTHQRTRLGGGRPHHHVNRRPWICYRDLVLEVTPSRLRSRANGRQGRSGKHWHPFDLSVDLPEPVDPDEVTATLEDGVLTARMVKAAWVRGEARRVPVREASIPPEQATHESGQAHA